MSRQLMSRQPMFRGLRFLGPFFWLFPGVATLVGGPAAADGDGYRAQHVSARALVAAVNACISSDIAIPPADTTPCTITSLPGSRANIVPLLPPEHRRLIAACGRGRTRVRRGVRGFDLLAMIEEPVQATDQAMVIRAFFDERPVDMAVGEAVSDGPYPIAFDWAVVLDHRTRTLFSFIMNCRD